MAVATPMHKMAPVSAGTDNEVPLRNSIHTMPANAAGNAVMITKGSAHDWKLTTIRQVDQHHRAEQPEAQTTERLMQRIDLPVAG